MVSRLSNLRDSGLRTWQTCADEGIALYKCCQLLAAEECFVESVRRARNESADKSQLAQALNNLAIVYYSRSKYHDATNILRESLSLTEAAETGSERLQKALAMHIHTQILIEQEHFAEARDAIIYALQQLPNELSFCAAEFWYNLVKAYFGLGKFAKAHDAVDSALQTTPQSLAGPYRIYIDESCGGSYFGPGWDPVQQSGSNEITESSTISGADTSAESARIEAEVRIALVRVSLRTQLLTQSKGAVVNVIDLCEPLGDHPLTAQALVIASRVAFGNSEWVEAANYCRRSLDIVEKIYGQFHPALLPYLINTASLTLMTDGLPDCISLMDRTFKIVEQFFGPRHPKYARCQFMWAGLMPFMDANNSEITLTQEKLMSEALDTFLDYFDDRHSTVLGSRMQLAEVLLKLDRVDDANLLLQQVFTDASTKKDTNPYPLIGCLSEMLKLALQLPADERYNIFDFIHREASQIDLESIEGPGRQIDLTRQLAIVFRRVGSVDKPEELLRRCFELSAQVCPDLHHRCKHDLIDYLLENGKPKEALEILERSREENTPSQELRDQIQIVKVNIALDRTADAEKLALAALTDAERMLPHCTDSFMQIIGVLIDIYVTSQRLDDAVRMIGILINRKAILGVPALDVIPLSLRLIADAYAQQSDARAEQLYQQSITAAEEIQGKTPETLDASIVAFADFCLSTGQIDRARKLFERWMELRSNTCGEDSFACAVAMLNVAEVSMDQDINRSLQLSSKALEIMDGDRDLDPEYLVAALNVRAVILEKANNQIEAQALVERAKALEKIKAIRKRKGKH